jgi:hypothetical protein
MLQRVTFVLLIRTPTVSSVSQTIVFTPYPSNNTTISGQFLSRSIVALLLWKPQTVQSIKSVEGRISETLQWRLKEILLRFFKGLYEFIKRN